MRAVTLSGIRSLLPQAVSVAAGVAVCLVVQRLMRPQKKLTTVPLRAPQRQATVELEGDEKAMTTKSVNATIAQYVEDWHSKKCAAFSSLCSEALTLTHVESHLRTVRTP